MYELPIQVLTVLADLTIFGFVGYYFLKFRAKEKELDKKEGKVDTDYHRIVETALAKERKILEDATTEADRIISGAQFINRTSSEEVNKALQVMIADIQKEAVAAAKNFMIDYQVSLKQMSNRSLSDFSSIARDLEGNLQKQIKEFQEMLLPSLQRELDEYRRIRLEQTEQMVRRVVQRSAQEILNKAISLDDHKNLVTEALEKAKKEGVFD